MESDNTKQKYIPGVCNIGIKELRSRRMASIAAMLAAFIADAMIRHYYPGNRQMELLVFLPLCAAFISALQVHFKFCIAFGLIGVFSFDGEQHKITDDQKEFLKADRQKAIKIIGLGILMAAAVTAVYYFWH